MTEGKRLPQRSNEEKRAMIYEERDYRIKTGKLAAVDGLIDVQNSRILSLVAYSPLQ